MIEDYDSLSDKVKKLCKKINALTRFYDTYEDLEAAGVCCEDSIYVIREDSAEGSAGIYICVDGELVNLIQDTAVIPTYSSMALATAALGTGKLFQYSAGNVEGATTGSVHVTQ